MKECHVRKFSQYFDMNRTAFRLNVEKKVLSTLFAYILYIEFDCKECFVIWNHYQRVFYVQDESHIETKKIISATALSWSFNKTANS